MANLDRARDILERAFVISLGTHDENGPWVADLLYVVDENFWIYWMSSPNSRHSRAIEQDGRVAATVTASVAGEKDFGLQIQGIAKRLGTVVGPTIVTKLLAKMGVAKLTIGLGRLREGYEWYVLIPAVLDLIDQAQFGFERMRLQLPDSSSVVRRRKKP